MLMMTFENSFGVIKL